MPFPFTLPTTSHVDYSDFFRSSTHPSLPLSATSSRIQLRDALKQYKRLPRPSQPGQLPAVINALTSYLPYLFALDAGLSRQSVCGEDIDVALEREVEVEWRCTLTATPPGRRDAPRRKVKSLDAEIAFGVQTLAFVHTLLARERLRPLYATDAAPPAGEQRKAATGAAMQHLLSAHEAHSYVLQRAESGGLRCASEGSGRQVTPVDVSVPVLGALASLALAEATLISVLKDDPYPTAVAEARNKHSTDWMFKAPELPKVRAHLFARLCLKASEHAAKGLAAVRNTKGVDDDLVVYLDDLRRTSRAKAARFLAIDAECQGKVGEGIAWLRGAMKDLGLGGGEDGRVKGFAKMKRDWKERREDKRVAKGGVEWGSDAGRFEEGRVLDMLEKKWVKMNDTMNVQLIPPSEPLLAQMPLGREYHDPKPFQVPSLDPDALVRMRAPPERADNAFAGVEDDSDEDAEPESPVGAFPGTKGDYSSTYYKYHAFNLH